MKNFINVLIFLLVSFSHVLAQNAGDVDQSFNTLDNNSSGNGTDGKITCSVLQPDGKIIIAGDFKTYNGVLRNNLARINQDGSLDLSFNANYLGVKQYPIDCIAIQPDGKIIVDKEYIFLENDNYVNLSLVRLNLDGSLDTTFNLLSSTVQRILSVFVQDDGKILIGGSFSSFGNIARKKIARLNQDGTLDLSFDPQNGAQFGLATDANGTCVRNFQTQTDGKIIIIGNFTAYNGLTRNHIARLNQNGSLDLTFDPGLGFGFLNGSGVKTNSISIQSDSKIIIGGQFSSYNNVTRKGLVRINVDGSLDTSFDIGSGIEDKYVTDWGVANYYPGQVKTTIVRSDGKIVAGGAFVRCNGILRNNVAIFNNDDQLDLALDTNVFFAASVPGPIYKVAGDVSDICLATNNQLILLGEFANYNTNLRSNIAKINIDATCDMTFNAVTGANEEIKCSVVLPNDKILIGGRFTDYNGIQNSGLMRLNSDGSADSSFITNYNLHNFPKNVLGNSVNSIGIQSDGKIIIALEGAGGSNTPLINSLKRLKNDGSLDSTNFPDINTRSVSKVEIQSDDKIIVAGDFYFNNIYQSLVRLNADCSLDSNFNFIGECSTFKIQPDGKILYFDDLYRSLKRLNSDGTNDLTFNNVNVGGANNIYEIAVQPDSKILICGDFSAVNGIDVNTIVRLNSDGTFDPSFYSNTNLGRVMKMKLQTNGKILIADNYLLLRRLNSDGTVDENFVSNNNGQAYFYEPITNINILSDNKILIVGKFTSYNFLKRNRICRLFSGNELGTSDFEVLNNIKIYPNPSKDFFNIQFDTTNKVLIEVYNTLGMKISDYKLKDTNQTEINLSGKAVGTYIVKITSDKETVFNKIIKY